MMRKGDVMTTLDNTLAWMLEQKKTLVGRLNKD